MSEQWFPSHAEFREQIRKLVAAGYDTPKAIAEAFGRGSDDYRRDIEHQLRRLRRAGKVRVEVSLGLRRWVAVEVRNDG